MAHQIGYWALVVLGFGFLILVHELGHFIACKLVGVRVERFALGFGPRLFGRKLGQTDYCICAIPCGGYIKMAGGEGEREATGAPDEFPSKTPGQRALVVAAGPAVSLLAAVPLLFFLLFGGLQRPASRIDRVVPGMGAWDAGLKRGDLITGLRREDERSWKRIRLWREVRFNAALKDKVGKIVVRVERGGQEKQFHLETDDKGRIGVRWSTVGAGQGYLTTTVGVVPRGGAADNAGIEPGSQILEIAGRKVHTWDDVRLAVLENPGKQVSVTFRGPPPSRRVKTGTLSIASKKHWGLGIIANRPNTVRLVRPHFPAEKAGLKPGDTIVAVNGRPVKNWPELERAVLDAAPAEIELKVTRAESKDNEKDTKPAVEELTFKVQPESGDQVGDVLGIAAQDNPVVEGFVPGSSSAGAGIPLGAELLSIVNPDSTGKPVEFKYADHVHQLTWPGEEPPQLELLYRVGGKEGTAAITLERIELGDLDLSPRLDMCRVVEPGKPLAALGQAFVETGQWMKFAVRGLWMLVRGKLSLKMLSGPVMILTATRYQAEAGLGKFIEFLVIITIHLGIINLVPFPILDGGHLAFLAIEKIRRKPLSERVMTSLMYAGMAVLIALMIFVTGNDIVRLVEMMGRR